MQFGSGNWTRNMPVLSYSRLPDVLTNSRETPANQIEKSGNTKETLATHH